MRLCLRSYRSCEKRRYQRLQHRTQLGWNFPILFELLNIVPKVARIESQWWNSSILFCHGILLFNGFGMIYRNETITSMRFPAFILRCKYYCCCLLNKVTDFIEQAGKFVASDRATGTFKEC